MRMKKVIEDILNNMILPEYDHVICGFDILMPDERFDSAGVRSFKSPRVTITFIGGPGTKLHPLTPRVQDMYDDVMNEIWHTIYDYTNITVDLYSRYKKECNETINESKEEKSKLKLVKDLIYSFFDEVSFIEQKEYKGKTLIKVYFESDDPAFNMDAWLVHQIKSKINEYTSGNIILVPRWHSPVLDFDFFIDAEKIKYDDDGNVINESENKKSNYVNVIQELVEPFKEEDCVCDVDVTYNEEDDMYGVYPVISTEDLNERFSLGSDMALYVFKLRVNINKTITNYLPIKNLYVGSSGVPNCDWKPNIREAHKVDKNDYIELYRDKDFILTIPLTHEASKKYGSDTKWCTTKKDCDKDFRKHTEMGVLGYIVVRDNELKERLGSNAFALYRLKGDDLTRTIAFDDQNNEYRNGESWLGNKFDRVDKLFQFYKLMNKYNDYFEKQEMEGPIVESKEISKADLKYNKVNNVLNRIMGSKYDWWKGIEIDDVQVSQTYFIIRLVGTLKVDEEWGGKQWREYMQNMEFPGNNGWEDNETYELVTLGDVIGSDLANSLSEEIIDVLMFTGAIDPETKPSFLSFRSIMLKFV